MKQSRLAEFFRLSEIAGILYEFVCFGGMLLCGYLLSAVLEAVMAAQWERMYRLAGYTAGALLVTVLIRYALTLWKSKAALTDTQSFRQFLYGCIIAKTVQAEDSGEMSVRLNGDVRTISDYYQQMMPKAIGGGVIMVCSAVLICLSDWRIGGIFFALNLTQLLPILVYEKWARKIYDQVASDEETYMAWMREACTGIRTLKAYCGESWYMKRYRALNQAIIKSGKTAEQAGTVETVIFYAIDSLLNYGSYLIIGLFVLFGGLPMGKTPLLIVLAGYLFSSISTVYDMWLDRFNCEEALKRLGFREIPPRRTDGINILEVKNVCKSFDEKQVLKGVSLTVSSGERVLLQGENGSGKSTLLRILSGLETPDSGEVILGIPQDRVTVSLQEEPAPDISADDLKKALERGGRIDPEAMDRHLKGFHIEDTLSSPLSHLSPGQRKKFYLAAALSHRGDLMILDEPTNHLDQESVEHLMAELKNYPGALMVCTHGKSIDLPWDKTVKMEGGVFCGA